MADAAFTTNVVLPEAAPAEIPAALGVEWCAGDRPLVLLPVRVETRFFPQPDGSHELRVRVYPDRIHIDSHETELTEAELEWGRHYWERQWRAGGQAQAEGEAWRQLAERFGAARAAWVARVVRPLNRHDRPASPVAADDPLPVPLQFPAVAVASGAAKDDAWRHAPLARLLPDRWVAIGYAQNRVVATTSGSEIYRPLAVGPHPGPAAVFADDELPVDAGMRWMVDFDAAETAGMALRLALPAPLAAAGLDLLLVVGVAASMTADQTAVELARLLDAHHYTDGFSFLQPAVATNNTEEARSGYRERDPRTPGPAAADINDADAGAIADVDSNAAQLAVTLGLPADVASEGLATVAGAAHRHARDGRSMNTALWSATWGYFLSNMIGFEDTVLTPQAIGWAREHFIANVSGLGRFAAIRCARQPYGVLPVSSLDLWQPSGEPGALDREAWLRDVLIRLRDVVWRAHLPAVPRLGRTSEAAADLAEAMRIEAQSSSYTTRTLLGAHYLLHLRAFLLEDLEGHGWTAAHDAVTDPILTMLGFSWRPRVARATYDDHQWRVAAPLVQDGTIAPGQPLEPNYIAALLAEPTIQQILEGHAQGGESASLLHALLRHGALLEYADAAARILSDQSTSIDGRDTSYPALIKDRELINLQPGSQPTTTWSWQLDQVVPAVTGGVTLRQYLEGLTAFEMPAVSALGAFRRSLAHLQSLDSGLLQVLAQGALDLASHRLDAWITSLPAKRLDAMRAAQPSGVYAGGYAWVENLRPAAPPTIVPPPAGEPAPVFAATDDTGFIHAPSLEHAATAALLRNAHLGHNGAAMPDGPFAIDLSSRRMREAQQLLDGVRQGQPLGALLGYRFERRLHDLSLDRFIDEFRDIAPLAADRLGEPGTPRESVSANNVVDGLLLHQRWPADVARLTALAGDNYPAIERELLTLGELIDAVTDGLTAETAYQLVRGNTSRTASTLQSVSQGDTPAPELEVARTPRSGTALTHRMVALFDPSTAGGGEMPSSLRASVEPVLNAWAATLLGPVDEVRCTVDRLDDTTGAVVSTREVLVSELRLGALDVVFGVDAETRPGTVTEIEQRLLYEVRRQEGPAFERAVRRIRLEPPDGIAPRARTLDDLLEQARNVRRLLARARPLDASDLDLPERNNGIRVDLPELSERTTRADEALGAAHTALQGLLDDPSTGTNEDLRTAILQATHFGIGAAIPASAAGEAPADRAALLAQGTAIVKELQARVDRGAVLRALPATATDVNARDRLLERLRVVFGESFVVLPRFTCANADELAAASAASTAVQGGDPLEVYSWFARCERVREPLYRFGAALRGAEVLNTGNRLRLTVAQLPPGDDERWVALPPLANRVLAAGRLSLVMQADAPLEGAGPLTGLLIDEWVEVVPASRETTAIALQFDPPDVCAPQVILLAVPPVAGRPWTGWDLQRVLLETLDLAKLRGVDPPSLVELAQYLPALYFGFNAADAAVSTDFAPLTR